jgi:hypothetical protein
MRESLWGNAGPRVSKGEPRRRVGVREWKWERNVMGWGQRVEKVMKMEMV